MEPFETRDFYGLLVKGDLPSAMRYLSQFPELAVLLAKYCLTFWGHFTGLHCFIFL